MTVRFAPGDLVEARGREWVVLPSPDEEILCLRPLSGAEADVVRLHPALELVPPRPARFELPDLSRTATQDAASLLSRALQLTMRRGAGPFRSAARVGFDPRAYQLVPLLMALRLKTVRLLIADDVGIGKTIEAGLILREMIDRGEVDRFAVLCPPHLVEQWTEELSTKFDLDAVAVTSASAARLERDIPDSHSLFEAWPYTVVSLDYIKADKRRESFARACPEFVIVDEAHACVGTHKGRQQRFDLLKRLSEDAERHMLLLTATPHSGDEDAFDRLLGLLNPDFSGASLQSEAMRERVARHFVQRRRIDVTGEEWGEDRVFPTHLKEEFTWALGPHRAFHDAVLDWCLGVVEGAGPDERRRRLAFWGTLALMRCVGSSPAAALSALRNRLGTEDERLSEQVFDEEADEADAVDVEPSSGLAPEAAALSKLIEAAEALTKAPDPKLQRLIKELKPLVDKGANPVVFCRFIATADHVAEALRKDFPKLRVEAVTGRLTADERRATVEGMADADQRILVATDCLSEGINLQTLFDTVVHYDLSWNPTRHQQREGRVNRFGQSSKVVRSFMLYSDSPIDGAVLDVIIRKAEAIQQQTGVTVPLPEEHTAVTAALMQAVLLRTGRTQQIEMFDVALLAREMETKWEDAEAGEKRSRTRFAQNAIKPSAILPEWTRWQDLVGGPERIADFTARAMSRLNAPLEALTRGGSKAPLSALPPFVRERLATRGLEGAFKIAFEEPARSGAIMVNRTHPLPATLAEAVAEGALDPEVLPHLALGRAGAWTSDAVKVLTTVVLLRLRYQLTVRARRAKQLLVEETHTAVLDISGGLIGSGEDARALLDLQARTDLAQPVRERMLGQAAERVRVALSGSLADLTRVRADELARDHNRVREANIDASAVEVRPVLPPDVLGLFVLVPGGAA